MGYYLVVLARLKETLSLRKYDPIQGHGIWWTLVCNRVWATVRAWAISSRSNSDGRVSTSNNASARWTHTAETWLRIYLSNVFGRGTHADMFETKFPLAFTATPRS